MALLAVGRARFGLKGEQVNRRIVLGVATVVVAIVGVGVGIFDWQRAQDAASFDREWQETDVPPVRDFGSTETIEIMPLVNWRAASEALKTEPGVSYLIRTDDRTVLFDLGFNRNGESPSPLEHNMAELGVELGDIDTIFISHNHLDHVGGLGFSQDSTFSLGMTQVDLSDKSIFVPVPMFYPGADVAEVSGPRAIAPAVASTGPIKRRLAIGRIDEQALVINLEGKGLVVIVGCGHQTLSKLLERVDAAFDEPIYAIVGDLHYPVPDGRVKLLGIDAQRRLASGDGIFAPLSGADVEEELATLERRLGFLALGGHDTSDEVLDAAAALMPGRFQRVTVGDVIRLGYSTL